MNMKKLLDSKLNIKEVSLWLGILIISIATFFTIYHNNYSSPVMVIIWLSWFLLCCILGFFTQPGKKVYQFSGEAKVELQKVVWPTRQETIQTTSIVMIMVAVTGFILWGIDSGMIWVIAKITHLG
ncbi:MAG: preprotein translocase subunit SecE [Pseudomonadales bacterium]|nr:preprotein translocase subunit SecE [Pseudomonadales bacterium]